ncbi:MAG: thioredoxin [Oscillospiraceae bacterium]|nr:thioredoxin [Oscillospiraceae bacterium]
MAIVHADTYADFSREVLNASGRVLVDFWAEWCGPCRMMAPVLEEFDKAYADIKVVKVNVDEVSEPAAQYRIDSIPALLLFENGEVKARTVGAMPLAQLAAKLGL